MRTGRPKKYDVIGWMRNHPESLEWTAKKIAAKGKFPVGAVQQQISRAMRIDGIIIRVTRLIVKKQSQQVFRKFNLLDFLIDNPECSTYTIERIAITAGISKATVKRYAQILVREGCLERVSMLAFVEGQVRSKKKMLMDNLDALFGELNLSGTFLLQQIETYAEGRRKRVVRTWTIDEKGIETK